MNGVDVRMGKLFDKGQNAVVVAVDHGMFDGPHAGMEDIPAALAPLGDVPDAILLSPGMLRRCRGIFGHRGAPLAITRININSVFSFSWGYRDAVVRPGITPAEAVALGADMVLICHTANTGCERRDVENLELFARSCTEAHRLGVPVLGEYFPTRHLEKSPEAFHQEVLIGCRMLEEFGADCIKTFKTVNFSEITSKVSILILGLGAEKTPTDREALELAWHEIHDGARGVVFGRNAVQASSPERFTKALQAIVKEGATVDAMVKKYKLN